MRVLIVFFCAAGFFSLAYGEVVFDRESGDEYFYSLRGRQERPLKVGPGDTLRFGGAGIVKGFLAPFREAAKKECGAWKIVPQSQPGQIVFEATHDADIRQSCDGFILVGRMGAAENREGTLGMIVYECKGAGIACQGELPGPVADPGGS